MASPSRPTIIGCLVGLATALMVGGVVSDTVIRHLVQILPSILALAIVVRRPDWGAYASIPIFVFWLAIVGLIWLFLLGLSSIANGRYTTIEILSTFLMAAFSVVGLAKSIRAGRPLGSAQRVLLVLLFSALQIAAMWVSFLRPIANR